MDQISKHIAAPLTRDEQRRQNAEKFIKPFIALLVTRYEVAEDDLERVVEIAIRAYAKNFRRMSSTDIMKRVALEQNLKEIKPEA